MKARCYSSTDAAYKDYGARGITVCERWLASFGDFVADMGDKPTKSHSIDRRENDLGYTPENCRWATQTEQAENKRSSIKIAHDGKIKTLNQLSVEFGISYLALSRRLQAGWKLNDALSMPAVSSRQRGLTPLKTQDWLSGRINQ